MRFLVFLAVLLLVGCQQPQKPPFDASSQTAELVLEIEGGATKTIPYPKLEALENLPGLTYDDPLFGADKRYIGLNLAHLRHLSGADDSHKVLKFHCRDGYISEVETEVLEQGQFMLAIRDIDAAPNTYLDFDKMTYLQTEPAKVREKMEAPELSKDEKEALKHELDHLRTFAKDMKSLRNQGPFYPIFIANDSLPKEKSWFGPFCVTKVSFAKSLTDRTHALPDNLPEDHPASKGSKLFSRVCSSCHMINGIGGKVGPELNRPMSVTEYWDEQALRQMMRDPSKVRAGSKMPAFNLKDEKIDDILAYLKWMAENKKVPIQ